jgi:hypothetical protein
VALLVVVTRATAPRVASPAALADRGELFFPTFTDPMPRRRSK